MKKNLSNILDRIKIGMWSAEFDMDKHRYSCELDDNAKKMFSVPDNIGAEECFEYWRSHIRKDYFKRLEDFFAHIIFTDSPFEEHFIWHKPGDPEKFIRIKGYKDSEQDGIITMSGLFSDITYNSSGWGHEYIKKSDSDRINYDLQRRNGEIVEALGTIVEFRNMESTTHTRCIKIFTRILASHVADSYPEYGVTDRTAEIIANAAPLHDIGKIEIPDIILLKPGRLTRAEFDLIKKHVEFGANVIDSLTMLDPEYRRYCREIAMYHHERYDGRGYLKGLKGDEIPISAQIVSLADVYDSLITPRVYKEMYTPKQAYNMIVRGECGTFNPKLMHILSEVKDNMEYVVYKYKNAENVDLIS